MTARERKLEIKAAKAANDLEHTTSAEAFAEAENEVGQYGITDWGDRLLEVVRQHRTLQQTEKRPLLFICHGTGGTVIKHALSKKAEAGQMDIATICLAVVFFATPHHGSSVLSEPEYVRTVSDRLELKWEMSEHLRNEFALRNPDLESLNYRFVKSIVGTKLYSYVESVDTILTVLSTNDSGGESITRVRLCITDSRSGKLGTPETPIEVEEVVQLNTTHIGAPRFEDEEGLFDLFIKEIKSLVDSYSDEQRTAFQALNKSIMSSVSVDVHQFYGDIGAMRILSAQPSLEEFLEHGPTQCMNERIRGSEQSDRSLGVKKMQPVIQIGSYPTPASTPAVRVTSAKMDVINDEISPKSQTLSLPKLIMPETIQGNIHARRPSLTRAETSSEATGHLMPDTQGFKRVDFSDSVIKKDTDRVRRPQHAPTFKLPSRSTDRFKWIHVPFNHSGWVPHILTTISQEKYDLSLHSKLLLDKIWFQQHNRSRHASPHARFVKPSVKVLFPASSESSWRPESMHPTSAGKDIQFVLYIPYLHWDNFTAMQNRATTIKRRREQKDARPVAADVARGKSLEHKIIWQYLTSDRPVHCRRTLDQYGYPSLRNTIVRDHDQILYKRTKLNADDSLTEAASSRLHGARSSLARQSKAPSDDGSAKVLMVDQLWLWIVDGQTVVTFFTSKEREEHDNGLSRECDIRSEIYQDINGDHASQCADPFDFAALAASHAIKALLEGASDKDLQIFRIFEEYISILTERQTSSFKDFRNNHRFERNQDIQASRHVDNRRDLDDLLELRDIEDELNTIDKLIREQQACVNEMISQYDTLNHQHSKGHNGTRYLHDVLAFLSDHKEQVDAMLKSAQAAQQAFKDLLDMKQKQANVLEAHLAREQTEVATEQSRSIMAFTIFTIIFLPLSFFASIFGINSREWSGEGNNYLPLHQIFTYMGSISLAVIIVALLVAFNKITRRAAQKVWQIVGAPIYNLLGARMQRFSNQHHIPFRGGSVFVYNEKDLEKAHAVDLDRLNNRLSVLSRSHSRIHPLEVDHTTTWNGNSVS